MKIMILVSSFGKSSPIEGAYLLAKFLNARGVNIVFVSLDNNYNNKEHIIDEIVEAKIKFSCLNIKGWYGLAFHRRILRNFVTENNIDIVISYMLRPDLACANLSNVVRISYVRGMMRKQHLLLHGKIITKIVMFFQMRSLRKMEQVWSMNDAMSEWLISEGIAREKIFQINNFVDVEAIRSSVSKNNQKKDINYDIGIFCSLIPRKRVDVAIKAMGKLIHEYKHTHMRLHIVGDGEQYNQLKQLSDELGINDKVEFHGFLSKPLQLMSSMDLILSTSEAEGISRSLMESMSLGKTIIAFDIPGIHKLIIDGQTGYVPPVGNAEKLAQLINNIIENQLNLPPEQLVDFMLENYDVKSCGEKILSNILKIYNNSNSKKVSHAMTLS